MIRSLLLPVLLLATGAAATALPAAAPPATASAQAQAQARDHASILAMAGTYKVTFDMRETTPFVAGYTPYPAKVLGGHEVVRAILDTPDRIVLQHLLVVDTGTKEPVVVKHWRQDWAWQPTSVLVYAAPGRWALADVSPAERAGAWSQTVWQTDDSPRYGAVGRWRYDNGVARWTSAETRRPLARRDATRYPPYDHYLGTNRHALTPNGWVQEEENAKIGMKDGRSVTFVHETLVNSYVPATDFPVAAADAYWAKTRDYWASVRADWDRLIAAHRGVAVREEPDSGSVTGHDLMLLADEIVSGDATQDGAARDAAALIAKEASAGSDQRTAAR